MPERIGRLLIPYTLPEVLRLVWPIVWQVVSTVAQVLAWSFFWRHHQAVAQTCQDIRRFGLNTS